MVPPVPGEFRLIARHFRPLAMAGALDLSDDAAVFAPPPGRELVVAADALVAGTHFLPDQPAGLVARKALRVNLSDLAAMGAAPLGYLMTLALPRGTPDVWVAAFAAGLAEDQAEFGLGLLGGDTTVTAGPLVVSVTVLGHVAPGRAVRRNGAAPGDGIWVTGTIGDAALGLAVAQGAPPDADGHLLDRYCLPRPRLALAIGGIASAAIDVSDGLVQELGHLARGAGLVARVGIGDVPLSAAALASGVDPRRLVVGGDDYELLLTVPPPRTRALRDAAAGAGIAVTRIGHMAADGPGVVVTGGDGAPIAFASPGWNPFRD